ncbi:MAG: hypothetical protein ACFFE8_04995 [Candidatus Heimdallarchaeota archaeon]
MEKTVDKLSENIRANTLKYGNTKLTDSSMIVCTRGPQVGFETAGVEFMNAFGMTELEQLFFGVYLMAHGSIYSIFLIYRFDKDSDAYLGWNGRSWLLDNIIPENIVNFIGKATWILIVLLFIVSGLAILDLLILDEFLGPLIIISATIATFAYIIFYDGLSPTPFHWILGVVINLAVIAFVIFFPSNVILLLAILILVTLYGMLFHVKIVSRVITSRSS